MSSDLERAEARVTQLRTEHKAGQLPFGMDACCTLHHIRTVPQRGEVEYRLLFVVPDGDEGWWAVLEQVQDGKNHRLAYRRSAGGQLTPAEPASVEASLLALPLELQLLGVLGAVADAEGKITVSKCKTQVELAHTLGVFEHWPAPLEAAAQLLLVVLASCGCDAEVEELVSELECSPDEAQEMVWTIATIQVAYVVALQVLIEEGRSA